MSSHAETGMAESIRDASVSRLPDKCKRRMLATLSLATVFATAFMALPTSLAIPGTIENADGTTTATWDFSDASDYLGSNVTFGSGGARLSFNQFEWLADSGTDFQGGDLTRTVVDGSGRVVLNLTVPAELLSNGDFTGTLVGTEAPPWVAVGKETSFSVTGAWSRNDANGMGGGPCWNNTFLDWDNAGSGSLLVWLNQTFTLPTLPREVNLSAMHQLVNIGLASSPGAAARIVVASPSGDEFDVASTGWCNSTTPYEPLANTLDSGYFNSTGAYKISLFTETNTTDDPTYHTADYAIFHNWDDASVKYSAYHTNGRYVSRIFDSGSPSFWKNASWLADEPSGTAAAVRVRSGNSNNTYDSSWSPWSNELGDPAGTTLYLQPTRYFQFAIDFETLYTDVTPSFESISVKYEKYHETGEVETKDFTPSTIVDWGYFNHLERLDGQNVSYDVSVDGGATWTAVPPDGDLRGLPAVGSIGRIRFRTVLHTGDASATPVVERMWLTFVGSNPDVSLDCFWRERRAEPGDAVRLEAYINNSATQLASSVWLNVTLPTEIVSYTSWGSDSIGLRIVAQQFDVASSTARFKFVGLAQGNYHAWVDATVKPGAADGTLHPSNASLEYTDPFDVYVARAMAWFELTPSAPEIEIWAECLDNALDFAETARYRIIVTNQGEGTSPTVWLNATIDDRLEYVDSSGGEYDSGTARWTLRGLAGGAGRILFLNASVGDGAAHGSALDLTLSAAFADAAGYVRVVGDDGTSVMTAFASSVGLDFVSSASAANPGEMLVATAYYNNSGHGTALWVNISITTPEHLQVNASNQAFRISGSAAYWNFSDVGPGPHSFAVTLKVADAGGGRVVEVIAAEMSVVDQVHGDLGLVAEASASISIERERTVWDRIYWPWSGAGAALGISLLAAWLWSAYGPVPPRITDVLFIYKDGRLISHRSAESSMRQELDSDLVSSMLTAVQQFVSDSMSESGSDRVKKLEFGEREIFIERGGSTYLAVIYTGDMSRRLNARMAEIVSKIESGHPSLAAWNGSMAGLDAIEPLLDGLIEEWHAGGRRQRGSLDEAD